MKITDSNLYIVKHKDDYTLNVQMPDGSRNYLHSMGFQLQTAIGLRDEFIGHYELKADSIQIVEDEGYYRIHFHLGGSHVQKVFFHSRKLNLQDAIYERMQLLVAED